MTRNQKQYRLSINARLLADAINLGSLKPFFGNQGVSLYRDGNYGDIIGYLVRVAGVAPRVQVDETDPNVVLALALGTTIYALPVRLQQVVIALAMTADDTKRSYARRIPKLVKLLREFATELDNAVVASGAAVAVPPPVKGNIVLPGKSI